MNLSSCAIDYVMFILHSTEDSWSPEKDGESRSILDWQWCRDSVFPSGARKSQVTGPLKGNPNPHIVIVLL